MKIMVVFYSLHVCPWIPGERKCFPILPIFEHAVTISWAIV
jgi:hypothetical protein